MARLKIKRKGIDWKELLSEEKDFLKAALQEVVQEVLEVEMEETVGARKSERINQGLDEELKKFATRPALVNNVVSES